MTVVNKEKHNHYLYIIKVIIFNISEKDKD